MEAIPLLVSDQDRFKAAILQFLLTFCPETAAVFEREAGVTAASASALKTADLLQKKWLATTQLQMNLHKLERQQRQQANRIELYRHLYIANRPRDGIPTEKCQSAVNFQREKLAFLHGWTGVAGAPAGEPLIKFYDLAGQALSELPARFQLTKPAACAVTSPCGYFLVAGLEDGRTELLDLAKWNTINCFRTGEGVAQRFLTAPSGSELKPFHLIVVGRDFNLSAWDPFEGRCLTTQAIPACKALKCAIILEEGQSVHVIAGTDDGKLADWGVFDHTFETYPGHERAVEALAAGKGIYASGGRDRLIRIWKGKESFLELAGHTDWVTALSFHPEGRLLVSASDDRSVRVWDTRAGVALRIIEDAHETCCRDLAYDPIGSRFLSWSVKNPMQIWTCESAESKEESHLGEVHTAKVTRVVSSFMDPPLLSTAPTTTPPPEALQSALPALELSQAKRPSLGPHPEVQNVNSQSQRRLDSISTRFTTGKSVPTGPLQTVRGMKGKEANKRGVAPVHPSPVKVSTSPRPSASKLAATGGADDLAYNESRSTFRSDNSGEASYQKAPESARVPGRALDMTRIRSSGSKTARVGSAARPSLPLAEKSPAHDEVTLSVTGDDLSLLRSNEQEAKRMAPVRTEGVKANDQPQFARPLEATRASPKLDSATRPHAVKSENTKVLAVKGEGLKSGPTTARVESSRPIIVPAKAESTKTIKHEVPRVATKSDVTKLIAGKHVPVKVESGTRSMKVDVSVKSGPRSETPAKNLPEGTDRRSCNRSRASNGTSPSVDSGEPIVLKRTSETPFRNDPQALAFAKRGSRASLASGEPRPNPPPRMSSKATDQGSERGDGSPDFRGKLHNAAPRQDSRRIAQSTTTVGYLDGSPNSVASRLTAPPGESHSVSVRPAPGGTNTNRVSVDRKSLVPDSTSVEETADQVSSTPYSVGTARKAGTRTGTTTLGGRGFAAPKASLKRQPVAVKEVKSTERTTATKSKPSTNRINASPNDSNKTIGARKAA